MHLPDDYRERVLQPWEEHPRRPVSWFEMLNFSARQFFYCGGALRDIRQDAVMSSACCSDGGEALFAMPKPIDDACRRKAIAHLQGVEPQFRTIGLEIAAETAKEVISELQQDTVRSVEWLIGRVDCIEKIANKELKQKAFFYIPPERMRFWPKQAEPFAFGKKVFENFHSTTFDANSAAFCLAATFSTACVFHLMRVLEIGLAVLGKQFGVSLAHTNWQPAIDQIESKIREMHKDPVWKVMSDCKEQQEFYAQAASHLAIAKDAWRNYTMHARAKYNDDEAELIFLNVKAFMQQLAERFKE